MQNEAMICVCARCGAMSAEKRSRHGVADCELWIHMCIERGVINQFEFESFDVRGGSVGNVHCTTFCKRPEARPLLVCGTATIARKTTAYRAELSSVPMHVTVSTVTHL